MVKSKKLKERKDLDAYIRGSVEHHHRTFTTSMKVAKRKKGK